MEQELTVLGVAATSITLIYGGIRVISFVSDRPKREEVTKMIEDKLEVVNVKIDGVARDVKRIADAFDKKTKR